MTEHVIRAVAAGDIPDHQATKGPMGLARHWMKRQGWTEAANAQWTWIRTAAQTALVARPLPRERRRRLAAANLQIVELTPRDAKQTLRHALRDAWRGHTWSQFLRTDSKAAQALQLRPAAGA